MGQQRNLNNQS